MTTTNTPVETADVRDLLTTEIDNVSGSAVISLGTWIRRLCDMLADAPEGSELVGCSHNMTQCTFQPTPK